MASHLRSSASIWSGPSRSQIACSAAGSSTAANPLSNAVNPIPALRGLAFGPLVAVDAQLGVVREVGAELQEERAEIGVDAIEVEVVDQPGGLHDPRVGITVGVAAFLGAEQGRLLLRPPDEHHPLLGGEALEVLVHHVVLALPLGEVDPRNTVDAGEPVHRSAERVGDLRQRRGRGDRQPQLPVHVADQPGRVLQAAEHRRSDTSGRCTRSRTPHARSGHRRQIALRS